MEIISLNKRHKWYLKLSGVTWGPNVICQILLKSDLLVTVVWHLATNNGVLSSNQFISKVMQSRSVVY
jgi:hypothetical protein